MRLHIQLNDPDFKEKIEKSFLDDPGTYVLNWFEDNKPRKICRLIGTDVQVCTNVSSRNIWICYIRVFYSNL